MRLKDKSSTFENIPYMVLQRMKEMVAAFQGVRRIALPEHNV